MGSEVNQNDQFQQWFRRGTVTLFALLFAMGLVVGGIGSFYLNSHSSTTLNNEVSTLQNQVATLSATQNQTVSNQPITIIQNGTDLPDLYGSVSNSVVLVHGTTTDGEVEGSGFVYNYSGQMVVITNFHVIYGVTGISVTFSDGNGYSAKVLGKDAYADLAVLSVSAPANEFQPLNIISSSSLRVGDEVIAIGNPYGLEDPSPPASSALKEELFRKITRIFSVANIIQTSTPINPGNSGRPTSRRSRQRCRHNNRDSFRFTRLRLRNPIKHHNERNRFPHNHRLLPNALIHGHSRNRHELRRRTAAAFKRHLRCT